MLLGGCSTASEGIKQAQLFGSTAGDFKEKSDMLAKDIYTSCIRKARFYQVYPTSDGIKKADETRFNALNDCEIYNRPAAGNAANANAVITNYVVAIASLASNKQVDFSNQLEQVSTSLKNFKVPVGNTSLELQPEAINTGIKIANFVLTLATNHYRGVQISKAMICIDPSLQTYAKGLRETYEKGYINGILDQEESMIRAYYNYYARILSKQPSSPEKATALEALDKSSYDALLPAIQNRLAAKSYLNVITATADTNTKIANVFRQSIKLPTEAECQVYLTPQKSQDKANSAQLNSKNVDIARLTPTQKMMIAQILGAYQRNIAPMLKTKMTASAPHQ
jgi:hypothetical protein